MKMNKFIESDFYNEIHENLKAIDHYMHVKDYDTTSDLYKVINISKLALKLMFDKSYVVSRTDEYIALVNEEDETDFLMKIFSYRKET